MTRKLTDEQVKQWVNGFTKINLLDNLYLVLETILQADSILEKPNVIYFVRVGTSNTEMFINKRFEAKDEAIAYAEHLLNQRYCWLPQNNGWIMSGEVVKFKDAGKVLELMYLAEQAGWHTITWDNWYSARQNNRLVDFVGYPTLEQLKEGITIHLESPIWDAVKGVE